MLLFCLTLRNIIMVELESPPRAQRREKSTLFTFIFRYFFTMQREVQAKLLLRAFPAPLTAVDATDRLEEWLVHFRFFSSFLWFLTASALYYTHAVIIAEKLSVRYFRRICEFAHCPDCCTGWIGLEHQTTHSDSRVRLRCLYGRDARCI